MVARYQLVIDCADPDRLAHFWAAALHYQIAPAPEEFDSWDDYFRDMGVDESELGIGDDRITDPAGGGPDIWFQQVPEPKIIKNRLHLDISVGGGRDVPMETRQQRIHAEALRLSELGAATQRVLAEPGLDHYGIAMTDPEGNEVDIN